MKSSILRKIILLFLVSFLTLASVRTASASATSLNWAGYVIAANDATAVSASWIIPTVSSCISTAGENQVTHGIGVWIGFDGVFNNAIPEQIGTLSECYNGSPEYYTWVEDAQQSHAMIALPEYLSAGDHITASIEYQGNDHFQLKIADSAISASRTYTITIPNSPRGSLEWIVEAFTNLQTQSQVSLPTFQPITFNDCSASVNNAAGSISKYSGQPLSMVDKSGNVLVSPQNLNQAGTSFQVAEVAPVPEFQGASALVAFMALSSTLILLRLHRRRFT